MSRNAFKLDVVSIRLVRDAPIYSDQKLYKMSRLNVQKILYKNVQLICRF